MSFSLKVAAVLLVSIFASVPMASASGDFEHPTVAHLTAKNYEESVRLGLGSS